MKTNFKLMTVAFAMVGLMAGGYTPSMAASPVENETIAAQLARIAQYSPNTLITLTNSVDQNEIIAGQLARLTTDTARAVASPSDQNETIAAEITRLARYTPIGVASSMEQNEMIAGQIARMTSAGNDVEALLAPGSVVR